MKSQFRIIKEIYDSLWYETQDLIISNNLRNDFYLENLQNDKRVGFTLIARPEFEIVHKFLRVINDIKIIEPNQHFYHEHQFHITILSIISATVDFKKYLSKIESYSCILNDVISNTEHFNIHFKGISASPECIIVQGFPCNQTLNDMRDRLRSAFSSSKLEVTIDQRYRLQTAHLTIIRFRSKLKNSSKLLTYLKSFRDHDFGYTKIDSLEFVQNDWYMSSGKVKILEKYSLKRN